MPGRWLVAPALGAGLLLLASGCQGTDPATVAAAPSLAGEARGVAPRGGDIDCRPGDDGPAEFLGRLAVEPGTGEVTLAHGRGIVDFGAATQIHVGRVPAEGRILTDLAPPGFHACAGDPATGGFWPELARGRDGFTVLVTTMFLADGSQQVLAAASADGGLRFADPVVIARGGGADENPLLPTSLLHSDVAADPTRPGTAHIVFERRTGQFVLQNELLLSTTTDGGLSWSPPRVIHASDQPSIGRHAVDVDAAGVLRVAVLRATLGSIIAIGGFSGPAGVPARVSVLRSDDAGTRFSDPVFVGDAAGFYPRDPDAAEVPGALDVFSDAFAYNVDLSIASGDAGGVYLAWADIVDEQTGLIRVQRSVDGEVWEALPAVGGNRVQPFALELAVHGPDLAALTWVDLESDVPGDETLDMTPQLAILRDGVAEVQAIAAPSDGRLTRRPVIFNGLPIFTTLGPGVVSGLVALPGERYMTASTVLSAGADRADLLIHSFDAP